MTGRSVENHCLVVLNVKLLVKRRFKTFDRLLNLLYTAFALNTTINKACFAQNFCMTKQQAQNLRTGTESIKLCIHARKYFRGQ